MRTSGTMGVMGQSSHAACVPDSQRVQNYRAELDKNVLLVPCDPNTSAVDGYLAMVPLIASKDLASATIQYAPMWLQVPHTGALFTLVNPGRPQQPLSAAPAGANPAAALLAQEFERRLRAKQASSLAGLQVKVAALSKAKVCCPVCQHARGLTSAQTS